MAGEDAPDGGHRGDSADQRCQVVGDGLGAGIEAGGDQALAEPEDGGLGLRVDLVGARMWASGARLQGFIATLAVTRQQPIDPAPRDAMAPG